MAEILEVSTEPVKTAQTTAPDTEPTGWMSPTGEIREGAPENVRTLLENKKWNSVEQIVDNYIMLEKQQGTGKHLVIPSNPDDPEYANMMGDIYGQLGRPETDDKYEFSTESKIPLSDELMDGFRKFAHKQNYTQNQFAGAIQFQLEAIEQMVEIENAQKAVDTETEETHKEEIRNAFKQKWGGEVAFQNKIKDAKVLADQLGIYQTLEAKGLASDPEIINMLDIISIRTAEDVIASQSPTSPVKTPIQEREDIMKSEAYKTRFHKDHKAAMTRYMELCHVIANAGVVNQPRI